MDKVIKHLFPHKDVEFSDMVKSIYPNFKALLSVIKYRPPRHKYFEYLLEMGRADIDRAFSKEPFKTNNLFFVFPERFMSVQETCHFMNAICKHPDALENKISTVLVVTSSPMIITDFMSEQVRIIEFEDDKKDWRE